MPGPLRVAVVARAVMPLHGLGGLERSVHDLVTHLARNDIRVTLITPPAWPDASRQPQPFEADRVTWRPVPYVTFPFANRRGTTILDRSSAYPVFGLRAGREALALARAGQVDIVHGYGASALGYALGRSQVRVPLVVNPQGLEEFGASGGALSPLKRLGYWPLRRAVLRTSRAADAIIATDQALVPAITRSLDPRPGQLQVIPNGIDVDAADALAGADDGRRLRVRHAIAPGEIVLLSVGRLEENKGFVDLAVALGRLNRSGVLAGRPWRWVLVGGGPFQGAIASAVASEQLSGQAIFAGRVSDAELHAWYEAATVFVHPTRYEGSSLVTLEAMAHRKAIVATRAGGLPDKVRPGENGWLVEPRDPVALASALEAAVAPAAPLAAMGTRSREILEQDFAWPVLVRRQIALYAQLLARVNPLESPRA